MKEKLEQIFLANKDFFSGTCLIKNSSEIIFFAASGLANRDYNIPNTINTMCDTASVTKTFTAAAILLLAEEGRIKLNDRITEIIDLTGTKIPSDVTVEHLLSHTSGIADDADEEAGEDYSALFIEKPNYSIRECKDFLPQFACKEPNFKAGTNVRYNNCAFVLLGLALEKLTGRDYRSFVTERIFKPCGMNHTAFYAKDELCPGAAEGYFAIRDEKGELIKWKKNIYSYPPIGTPDGGAYTTVGDLDLFMRAIQKGTLLSQELSKAFLQPHCEFTREASCGCTWRMGYAFEFLERDGRIVCIYKEGVNAGVDAMFSYYPEWDISLNLLSNQEGGLWKMHEEMRQVLLES